MGWHGWDCLQGWDLCPLVSHPSQLQLHRRMITFLAGASKSSLREAQKRITAKGLTPNTTKEQHWALLWGVMDKEGRETGRQWCKNLIFPASWGDAGWWLHTVWISVQVVRVRLRAEAEMLFRSVLRNANSPSHISYTRNIWSPESNNPHKALLTSLLSFMSSSEGPVIPILLRVDAMLMISFCSAHQPKCLTAA